MLTESFAEAQKQKENPQGEEPMKWPETYKDVPLSTSQYNTSEISSGQAVSPDGHPRIEKHLTTSFGSVPSNPKSTPIQLSL